MTSNNQTKPSAYVAGQGSENPNNDSQNKIDIPSNDINQGSSQEDLINYDDDESVDDMDVDDVEKQFPALESIKSSGPPHLFSNQQTGNEIVKGQLRQPLAIGASKETGSGSNDGSPMNGHASEGHTATGLINLTAEPRVGHTFSPARSSTMASKYAHVTIKSLEADEIRMDNLIQDLQNQSIDLLTTGGSESMQQAQNIESRIDMLSKMLQRIRDNLWLTHELALNRRKYAR